MTSLIREAIIRTLCYADVFDYPLTENEIWTRFIGKRNLKEDKYHLDIRKIKEIEQKAGLYFLKGRGHVVGLRQKKDLFSKEKLQIAQKITSLIRFIPSVKLVGISGGLAIANAKDEDDIDLFIVASKDFLWITRFIVTLLVELFSSRRHPADLDVKNKVCLNIFIDEEHLSIPILNRNLFIAYEVVQLRPLFDKKNTHQKFLSANLWVKDYLPNSIDKKIHKLDNKRLYVQRRYFRMLYFIELCFKKLQLWYMSRKRTTELITDGRIYFHSRDTGNWVMKNYRIKLKKYGVLLEM